MKFKNKKLVIIMNGILIIIILSTISGVPNNAESSEKKLIIVGGEYDYPPYSFLDPKGKPAGFSVELTIAVARAMGLDVEINLTPWSQARKSLEDSKIDIILGMFYSPEREQIFDFSTPYSVVNNTIFARKGFSEIQSIEEIRNKEIIVMEGEIMHDYAIKNKLTDRLLLSKTPSDAMRLLASGKGDYALIAYTPGLYWVKTSNLSNIIPVGPPLLCLLKIVSLFIKAIPFFCNNSTREINRA